MTDRAAAAGLLLAGLLLAAPPLYADDAAPEPLAVVEVAPGIWVHRGPYEEATAENLGGFANIGFVVGTQAAAVIDPGGSFAQGRRLLAALRRATALPLAAVIVTHVHPDHALGAAAFIGETAAFVGHAKLPAALAARGAYYIERLREPLGALADGTEVVMPDTLVEPGPGNALRLELGGRTLTVTAHPTAHTDHDLTIFDSATETLWASDLVFLERIPAIDGSLKGWLAEIAALRSLPAARVVPGHGPVSAAWPAALDDEERYFRVLLTEIRRLIAEGGSIEAAVETVGRSEAGRWALFEAYHARNVLTAYTELEWE